MKNLIFASLLILSASTFAQDTLKTESSRKCQFNHEIGINATLLLKQVFNLSNNTFPTLPYDITYKLISNNNKWAIRAGVGVSLNNSTVSSTTTTASLNQPPSGPDQAVPTETNSTNLFYRVGWERRFINYGKILPYAGFDIAGQFGTSKSQSSNVSDNLPFNYSYTKTSDKTVNNTIGGGPVAGIQFFITKKISLFTEIPIYFFYTQQKESTNSFQNQLDNNNSGTYTTSENDQTIKTTSTKLSVNLPVTLYLAIKF